MSENQSHESVVICEGYYDRAFWDGILTNLGCVTLKPDRGAIVTDPFGEPVRGGQFAYRSKSGGFVRIEPARSKDNVRPAATFRLKNRTDRPLSRLVLNVDADTNADGSAATSVTMTRQSMTDLVRGFDPSMIEALNGSLLIDSSATTIDLIRWEANDPPTDGLPNQQTLERMVCASIAAAYPDRAPHVHQWLIDRPSKPQPTVKEHAWSYMAGWYPEHGCDAFYGLLWKDEQVADQLEIRLKACGAWDIAQALAE